MQTEGIRAGTGSAERPRRTLRASVLRAAAGMAGLTALAACQNAPRSSFDDAIFADETRALERQLDAEAAAVGTAQAAMSMPAAWDPTGAASLVTTPAGL